MHRLFTELRQLLALSLDGHSLCQLASCNHQCLAFIKDDKLWEKLLSSHFQALPFPQVNAFHNYKVLYTWPKRAGRAVEVIWTRLAQCPYDLPKELKSEWLPIIKEAGPLNYSDIGIIWPQLIEGKYDLPEGLKVYITDALLSSRPAIFTSIKDALHLSSPAGRLLE